MQKHKYTTQYITNTNNNSCTNRHIIYFGTRTYPSSDRWIDWFATNWCFTWVFRKFKSERRKPSRRSKQLTLRVITTVFTRRVHCTYQILWTNTFCLFFESSWFDPTSFVETNKSQLWEMYKLVDCLYVHRMWLQMLHRSFDMVIFDVMWPKDKGFVLIGCDVLCDGSWLVLGPASLGVSKSEESDASTKFAHSRWLKSFLRISTNSNPFGEF